MTCSLLGAGGSTGLLHFWSTALQQPWLQEHPFLRGKVPTDLQHCIPTLWHIDGAEVYRNAEFYVFSWRSVLTSHDEVMDTQLFLGICCSLLAVFL